MQIDVALAVSSTGAQVLTVSPDGEVIQGNLSTADLAAAFTSVTVDSRQVEDGSLFVALPGMRVDGHDFVASAVAGGARGALISRAEIARELRPRDQVHLFVVPETLAALHHLARRWRMLVDPVVVGITGSVGKTTSKEIVAGVLARSHAVLKSEGNLNTEIGLPLTLLRLRPTHEVAVLEMGMYVPGDIATLARIARPDIGIVTTIAPVHLERAGSIEAIARGKSELIAALPADGLAVLNGDNPWTRAMAQTSGIARAVLAGLGDNCDVRAEHVETHGIDGVSFTLHAEEKRFGVRSHIPGAHIVHSLLFAAAVGRALEVPWQRLITALQEVGLEARQRFIHGPNATLIIDDSYNAAPPSMHAALALLAAAPGQKIAVLGDMLELGPEEEAAHREVGAQAATVADWLVVRGERGSWIALGAVEQGFPRTRVVRPDSNAEAVAVVRSILADADCRTMREAKTGSRPTEWSVLVKGSRGMQLEEVVQGLRGEG